MTSRWTVCALTALLCVAASAQAPDGSQPAAPPAPQSLRLTLPEALQRVLQCHPTVQTAQLAITQAQSAVQIARARRWPQLNADAAVGQFRNLGDDSRTSRDAAITLDFEIFDTTRDAEIKRIEVLAEASRLGLPDVQRQLAFEVANTYYRILATERLARALIQSVAASERHLELVEARIEEGVAPRSDLLPVQVEVSGARLRASQAESDLQTQEAALRALLQIPAGTSLDLAPAAPSADYDRQLPDLLAQARTCRPDVREQELNVRAAELSTRVAQAEAGVQFNARAQADYGYHTGETGDEWSLQGAATYARVNAGASKAALTSARAGEEIARQRLDTLLLQVQEQVEAAHAQARQAAITISHAQVALRDAELSLQAAEARYAEGLAIIIEVTDAQVALLQAQVDEIQARLDYAAALAALDLATGAIYSGESS